MLFPLKEVSQFNCKRRLNKSSRTRSKIQKLNDGEEKSDQMFAVLHTDFSLSQNLTEAPRSA